MKRYLAGSWALSALYLSCVPLANWATGNVGACDISGPCLLPVGFGLYAPAGVYVVAISLALRDAVQTACGVKQTVVLLLLGSGLSLVVAAPSLALASAVAFLVSEVADLTVFTPLRRWSLAGAVFLSGVCGLVVDSALFLALAFGSLDFLQGQIVGKFWGTLVATVLVFVYRRYANRKT